MCTRDIFWKQFSLSIDKQKIYQVDYNAYITGKHQVCTIIMRNDSDVKCYVVLKMDDEKIGTWIIPANEKLSIYKYPITKEDSYQPSITFWKPIHVLSAVFYDTDENIMDDLKTIIYTLENYFVRSDIETEIDESENDLYRLSNNGIKFF